MAEMRCPYCGNSVSLDVEASDDIGTCSLCGAHYAVETRDQDPDEEFAAHPVEENSGRVYAHVEEDGTPYTVVFF